MFQFQSQPDTSQIGLLYALGLSEGFEGVDRSMVDSYCLGSSQQVLDQYEGCYHLKDIDF